MIQRSCCCSVFTIFMLGALGVASASNVAAPSSASGEGSMTFGKDGHGVGYFVFDVTAKPQTSGSLLFAAEQPHFRLYPDVIVRVGAIKEASWDGRPGKFSGAGMLNGESVTVQVRVFDGAGTTKPDRFSITCTDKQGNVVFEADGEVSVGGVVVGG